jgi:signal peptidase I
MGTPRDAPHSFERGSSGQNHNTRRVARTSAAALAIGILLGIIIKLFAADFLLVSGQSMEPVIADGTRIFVSKLSYGLALPLASELFIQWADPQKNDVVIYIYNNKTVVKRCAATEGDALEYSRDSTYRVTVNGKVLPLTDGQYQRLKYTEKVPDGTIFAIGDNMEESVDSRHYGFVSVRNILGKVLCK